MSEYGSSTRPPKRITGANSSMAASQAADSGAEPEWCSMRSDVDGYPFIEKKHIRHNYLSQNMGFGTA